MTSPPTSSYRLISRTNFATYCSAVTAAINRMEALGYADRLAWLKPIPTGRNGEYISVMSRRTSSSP